MGYIFTSLCDVIVLRKLLWDLDEKVLKFE